MESNNSINNSKLNESALNISLVKIEESSRRVPGENSSQKKDKKNPIFGTGPYSRNSVDMTAPKG